MGWLKCIWTEPAAAASTLSQETKQQRTAGNQNADKTTQVPLQSLEEVDEGERPAAPCRDRRSTSVVVQRFIKRHLPPQQALAHVP